MDILELRKGLRALYVHIIIVITIICIIDHYPRVSLKIISLDEILKKKK